MLTGPQLGPKSQAAVVLQLPIVGHEFYRKNQSWKKFSAFLELYETILFRLRMVAGCVQKNNVDLDSIQAAHHQTDSWNADSLNNKKKLEMEAFKNGAYKNSKGRVASSLGIGPVNWLLSIELYQADQW